MRPEEFKRFVVNNLNSSFLSQSGSLLYSTAETLREGRIYLMGINPGGKQESSPGAIIDNIYTDRCAYFEPGWGPVGEKFQERVRDLIRGITDKDINDICASNLIFRRTPNDSRLQFKSEAETCWPVHEKIFEIVMPQCLILLGTGQLFSYVHRMLSGGPYEKVKITGENKAYVKSFEGVLPKSDKKVSVLAIPHPSTWYRLGLKDEDIRGMYPVLKSKFLAASA